MRTSKIINTQVVHLPILVSLVNTIPGVDFGMNREMIITDLLSLASDRLMSSFYDTASDLTRDDVFSIIIEYIPISSNIQNLVEEILNILNMIKDDIAPMLILESIPNTLTEVSYILNEYVTFKLCDIHPIERIRRIP